MVSVFDDSLHWKLLNLQYFIDTALLGCLVRPVRLRTVTLDMQCILCATIAGINGNNLLFGGNARRRSHQFAKPQVGRFSSTTHTIGAVREQEGVRVPVALL